MLASFGITRHLSVLEAGRHTMARYDELLAQVPRGDFYNADGAVLPNSDKPYTFRLKTTASGAVHDIFLNGNFAATVTSDANSIVEVNLVLNKGTNTIEMRNRVDGLVTRSYVTTRDWATWLAGVADILQPMDDAVAEIKSNRDLETVDFANIDPIWGRRLRNKNSYAYSIETYRDVLRVLHKAYRRFGGRLAGLQESIAIFTQVNPLIFPITYAKQWRLGTDFVPNRELRGFSRAQITTPTINAGGAGVTVKRTCYSGAFGIGSLSWDPATRKFTLTDHVTSVGTSATVPTTGSATVSIDARNTSPRYKLTTLMGPFNTASGYNKFALDFGGRGIIVFTLPYLSLSAASLIAEMQAAISADPRYSGYGGLSLLQIGNAVEIRCSEPITLHPVGVWDDASRIIFGIPWIWGRMEGADVVIAPGDTTKVLTTTASFPTVTGANTYRVIVEQSPTPISLEVLDVSPGAWVQVNVANVPPQTIAYATPFWVEGQVPYTTPPQPVTTHLDIDVTDCSKLANVGGAVSDTLTFGLAGESPLPTSWYWNNGNAVADMVPGVLHDTALAMQNLFGGGTFSFSTEVRPSVLKYRGFAARIGAWVAHQILNTSTLTTDTVTLSVSFDGGNTYAATTTVTVPPNQYIPSEIYIDTTIPTDATKVIITLTGTTSGISAIRFEEVYFKVHGHTAISLGRSTIPRAANRGKRGHVCYIWCPNDLLSTEQAQIGLPQGTIGHIDYIAPAQSVIERFLVNEITSGTAKNVVGAFTATDFSAGTLTHMSVVARSPARFSYAAPTAPNHIRGERVYPAVSIPHTITLAEVSDQDLTKVVLYEDGIPVTHDVLHFTDSRTIVMDTAPDTTKVYTIDYNRLIQFETAVLTLPADFNNYLWFVDAYMSSILNMVPVSRQTSTGIQFDSNYQATLKERSDTDQSVSTLIVDNGQVRTTVDTDQWEYVDATTVRINANSFDPNSIYSLIYTTRSIQPKPRPTITLEIRQSSNLATVTSQLYKTFNINSPVPPVRYFQLRVTLSNIQDVRDARFYSCCLKGLNLFGSSGYVPLFMNPPAGSVPVTVPAPVIISPADQGTIWTAPMIEATGTGQPGATITLYVDGIQAPIHPSFTNVVDANGNWSIMTDGGQSGYFGTLPIYVTQTLDGITSDPSPTITINVYGT